MARAACSKTIESIIEIEVCFRGPLVEGQVTFASAPQRAPAPPRRPPPAPEFRHMRDEGHVHMSSQFEFRPVRRAPARVPSVRDSLLCRRERCVDCLQSRDFFHA
jgi:hypothetical protein